MKPNMKAIREKSGKTQQEVADDLGVSVSTYRSWEQGKRDINGKKLMMLADYFEVTTDDIIGTKFSSVLADDADAPDESNINETSVDDDVEDMRLLLLFHKLNHNGKCLVIDYVDTLVRSGKYEKKTLQDNQISEYKVS